MDITEKINAIVNHCKSKYSCSKCELSRVCALSFTADTIPDMIDELYRKLPSPPPVAETPTPTATVPSSTEDGTAKGAAHYLSCPIQPIELMQYTLTREELIGFLKGNIIKYSLRAGRKGDPEKDTAKALQYKKWLTAVLKGEPITI